MPREEVWGLWDALSQGRRTSRPPRPALRTNIWKYNCSKMGYFLPKSGHFERQNSRAWIVMSKPFNPCVDYGLQSGDQPQFGRLKEEHWRIEMSKEICKILTFLRKIDALYHSNSRSTDQRRHTHDLCIDWKVLLTKITLTITTD